MRILIALPAKVGFDGMTKQVLSYSKYMDKIDVEIDLLSSRGIDPEMKTIVDNANFDNVFRIECRDTNPGKYFIKLLKLLRRRNYDIFHANGQSATMALEMLAAKICGCKLRIAHSHNSSCLHMKKHKLLLPLFKATYNDAIACSKEAGNWLFGNEHYWILNNGIDTSLFEFNKKKRDLMRSKLGLSDDEIAVGNVATFDSRKNHVFLLDLFESLNKQGSSYNLFLWGKNGKTKDDVIRIIKKKNLKNTVSLMGTTDHIWDYLQAMDIMVLPSEYEGFPVAVVEWQAAGLPCIISDTITKDANINGLVQFAPIDRGPEPWIESLNKATQMMEERDLTKWNEKVKDAGFNIVVNVKELKNHYIQKLNELDKR